MRKVEEYEVFKLAHNLVLKVYKLTAKFPGHERYGLAPQVRRAAYSIPMNLVEGGNRRTEKEFSQFINVSIGSCAEVLYQLLLAKDLGYINEAEYGDYSEEYEKVKKMLSVLLSKVSGGESQARGR